MKKSVVICVCLFLIFGLMFVGFMKKSQVDTTYFRIHIRANSNEQADQNVKYEIKAKIVDYLTPLLCAGDSFEKAKYIVDENLQNIEDIANEMLMDKGFSYKAKASLNTEFFPTRSYENLTLKSGVYDALIISLGSASGDNWWCVVYPPLCFTTSSNVSVVYKSKILEIIRDFLNK